MMKIGLLLVVPTAVTLYFAFHLRRYWLTVDQFLEALHDDHHEIWVELGSPCGWQWSAPGRVATPFSMFSFRWAWLRQDPEWLSRAGRLRVDFSELRRSFRHWNFRAMPMMVAAWVLLISILIYFEPQ